MFLELSCVTNPENTATFQITYDDYHYEQPNPYGSESFDYRTYDVKIIPNPGWQLVDGAGDDTQAFWVEEYEEQGEPMHYENWVRISLEPDGFYHIKGEIHKDQEGRVTYWNGPVSHRHKTTWGSSETTYVNQIYKIIVRMKSISSTGIILRDSSTGVILRALDTGVILRDG